MFHDKKSYDIHDNNKRSMVRKTSVSIGVSYNLKWVAHKVTKRIALISCTILLMLALAHMGRFENDESLTLLSTRSINEALTPSPTIKSAESDHRHSKNQMHEIVYFHTKAKQQIKKMTSDQIDDSSSCVNLNQKFLSG
jgi:ABC-type nickel/cobalt efflux system permease component RcnA